MSSSKKRPFSEITAGDFYLCADCDAVYHGQQELCEHLAKHSNLRRQARKRICLRKKQNQGILDYTKTPQQLIPSNLTDDESQTATGNVQKLSGIEQLTKATKMNDHYYTYHQLKMALNTIATTRRKPAHSMRTSLDIIHDINVLRHSAKQMRLQCANSDLFDRIQTQLLGANFKQPPLKMNEKMVKNVIKKKAISKPQNDKEEMEETQTETEPQTETDKNKEDQYEIVQEKKVQFEFDSSDFQRYLDANSEIIGRLQTIRNEKSFYGVTQEEIDLNKQFAENTATMVHCSTLPGRLLA